MTTYTHHPVADIFPMMSNEEFEKLCADIQAHGLLEPIWTTEGTRIVDGRNRYKACLQVGVDPRFREWNGNGSLVDFVISLNVHRRHLSKTQLSCVGVQSLVHYAAEAKERQKAAGAQNLANYNNGLVMEKIPELAKGEDPPKPAPTAVELAGAAVGVNPRYVHDAKKISEVAPEKFKEMQAGNLTIQDAKREVREEKRAPEKLVPIKIDWKERAKKLETALALIVNNGGSAQQMAIDKAAELLEEIRR